VCLLQPGQLTHQSAVRQHANRLTAFYLSALASSAKNLAGQKADQRA
jgi:hypothetical protein